MKPKIVAFDMDEVLCSRTLEDGGVEKYYSCYPLKDMIDIVNECHEKGFHIIIYTARGMSIFKGNVARVYDNLYALTKNQLKEWGVKHHDLIMGKPHYDILIDDKVINSLRVQDLEDITKRLE